jgi:hypothetical protein
VQQGTRRLLPRQYGIATVSAAEFLISVDLLRVLNLGSIELVSSQKFSTKYPSFGFGCRWSIGGAHFDEIVVTKRPVNSSLPTAAMERADRKFPELLWRCC